MALVSMTFLSGLSRINVSIAGNEEKRGKRGWKEINVAREKSRVWV